MTPSAPVGPAQNFPWAPPRQWSTCITTVCTTVSPPELRLSELGLGAPLASTAAGHDGHPTCQHWNELMKEMTQVNANLPNSESALLFPEMPQVWLIVFRAWVLMLSVLPPWSGMVVHASVVWRGNLLAITCKWSCLRQTCWKHLLGMVSFPSCHAYFSTWRFYCLFLFSLPLSPSYSINLKILHLETC